MAIIVNKSPSITNWDATPVFIPTTGEGVEGPMRVVTDNTTVATTDSIGSTYRLVRIPTNAKVKRVVFNSVGIATTGTADFDVAFSDSTTDGTQQSLAGGVVQITGPADNKLFGSAQSILATKQLDVTFAGTFTLAMQNLPLWQALVNLGATQFVADPGGFFDLILKLTAAAGANGTVALECDYVE